jgi:hypothetical protein
MWKQRKEERNENKKDSRKKKMSRCWERPSPVGKKLINLMLFSE